MPTHLLVEYIKTPMESAVNSFETPKTSNAPPELDVFLDFISDDDRPTFVLEQSTTPRIIFRNAALDRLVVAASQESSFLNWVDTLSNIAGDSTAQHLSRIEELGTFASRAWSSKRVGGAWTAVFCRQDQDHVMQDTQPETWPAEPQDVTLGEPQRAREVSRPAVASFERHESDNISTSESSTLYSHSAHDIEPRDGAADGLLGDMVVDWLLYPHLTPDPFVHFLTTHDWDKTAIGPLRSWHPTLRQLYATILSSAEPRVIYWGNDLCMFYNEAARFVVGEMHPYPLGNPLADVWGVAMHNELMVDFKSGIHRGKAVYKKRTELVLTRYGFPESCFFNFVFLPIPSPDGHFMGIFNEFIEMTETVVQENRHKLCRTLLEDFSRATRMQDIWTIAVKTLEERSMDVSYAIVYTAASSIIPADEAESLRLQASFGVQGQVIESTIPPAVIEASERAPNEIIVLQQRKNTLPLELAVSIADVGIVNTACILPIVGIDGRRLAAILVLGLSPIRPLGPSTRQFAASLRDLLFKSAALFSLPLEQRRAQELTAALSQQLQSVTVKAERSEENFTRMVRDAPIGMCMNRGDGYPIYVNDMYLELLGLSRASFYRAAETGFAWRDVIFEDDIEAVNRRWESAIGDKKPAELEFRVKSATSPDGARWLEAVSLQRYDENGKMVFLYGWLTDISSRKLTESLVEKRLTDALETKRSSENFIDMVSHEMRNPLSSILQLADNVLMSLPPIAEDGQVGVLTADARHSLVDSAQTISIIDEVLTFSKLDSKLLVLAPERVQPPTIIESALKMVNAELEAADIQGSINIHQRYRDLTVDYVLLDPGRLLQVVINLLTNAIKFTQGSSTRHIAIGVSASRTRPSGHDCQVTLVEPRRNTAQETHVQSVSSYQGPLGEEIFLVFSVQDTGCGLTEDEMKHLFHRFSQASPKTYKSYGGSGLGLFISRELTELQGGQIGVHSISGEGSNFTFYVKAARVEPPLEAPQASFDLGQGSLSLDNGRPRTRNGPIASSSTDESHLEQPRTAIQDLHVLVVEDNAINQKVMAQQLRKLGCAKVHVADHGLDALNFLSTTTFFGPVGAGMIPLSIVLLDVEMPVMDGLTAARRIRGLEENREILQHVPIIGITANARADQVASCLEAGMDEVMTKPFRMPQLVPRMLELVDKYKSTDRKEGALVDQKSTNFSKDPD